MTDLRLPALLALLLAAAPAHAWDATVQHVKDGDTFTALRQGRPVTVRIARIDASEAGQPGSRDATAALTRLLGHGAVEIAAQGKDRYGRTVADVTARATDVGEALVRQGHAWQFTRYDRSPRLAAAQATARRERAGLWAGAQPVPPWDWRRGDWRREDAAGPVAGICGRVRSCGEAQSCGEAMQALQVCGLASLDRDGDGVPCESVCRP